MTGFKPDDGFTKHNEIPAKPITGYLPRGGTRSAGEKFQTT